ncbi:MAG TPA: hypothetical protein VGO47_07155, partial [Chlamydiales bacterium]|nr:hypothetical protein [Chlamydiales bacterium]
CLVAGCQENSCPVCTVGPKERGDPCTAPYRNPTENLNVLRVHASGHKSTAFKTLCLCPLVDPFWAKLPHVNIFACFTPDLLHQLHKGVFKDHLVKWCIEAAARYSSAQEIDKRFKCMPSHPNIRHFRKGISAIAQWTGKEIKEMERVFASLLFGAVPPEVTQVARAIIDFIYYASFPSHSTETIRRLQDALDTFHEYKKVFIKMNIQEHFRIPKIHSMEHYAWFIRQKGALDGYNTELSERMHILVKDSYRDSN